ncbi:Gfo/Idh/MocA family oxidoreductase [Flavobacterium sp. ANB]|uniref:Gfo/Idh/MocA family protein n=1 Tax=unclassified Flavobacterium TaxID=196869 RepID=UPI0012B9614A|nr:MULTISPECIES: Gfo/Idh/MocA family oxidoreductase [unclassified Flavobacterium]MBF4515935.1 Gfo/Idh/MocA family oxidoreductase [Flavobacterium sp. ANB]MTD68937.1 gfo/Idh/MocA family oxidoreductase [Flavobacterium sp. LC2016-13]
MQKISRRSFVNKFGIGVGASVVMTTLPSFLVPSENQESYKGKKINIALCGLGNYAEMLAYGIEKSEYCTLTGIVTGTPSKAEKWKAQYNIPNENIYNYQNFDEIINNKNIDLVYVVVPNGLHKEFVIRAAKAGKHVITEKPMAVSVKDCEEMIKTCNDANVQLAIGYRLHYEPYHLELKRLGQNKVFGQVRFIEASLGYKTYDTTSKVKVDKKDRSEWRLTKALSGGGPLMDLGIYCIQSARYVLGEEPIAVTAQFGTVNDKDRFSETEESISWQMEFPSGAVANCNTSCGFYIDRFYATADEGFFQLSPALSYGPFEGKTSEKELKFPVINQQKTQLDEICKVLVENKKLPNHITGEEGLKDIRIINAIYKAAETGKKVQVK